MLENYKRNKKITTEHSRKNQSAKLLKLRFENCKSTHPSKILSYYNKKELLDIKQIEIENLLKKLNIKKKLNDIQLRVRGEEIAPNWDC